MHTEKLIQMANDIANFFNAETDKVIAAEGVTKHILRSWDPRMRRELVKYYQDCGGNGLNNLASEAVKKLAEVTK